MSFTTLYPGIEKLILTEAEPATAVKSAYEALEIGPPGQPDKLTLFYDAFFSSTAALNTYLLTHAIGTDLSATAVTAGTWILEKPVITSGRDLLPFATIALQCQGLAQSKADAVRWFAVTESLSAENVLYDSTIWPKFQAEIISYGVEIDKLVMGSDPNMAIVGTASTPADAPTPRTSDWTSLSNPTRHYPDGWYLADLRTQQLAGSGSHWLATYVYRYKYALSP